MKFAIFLLLIDALYALLIWIASANFERLQAPGSDTPASSYLLYVALPIALAIACALGQSFSRALRNLLGDSSPTTTPEEPSVASSLNTERLAQVARELAAAGDTAGLTILLPSIAHATEKGL